MFELDQMKETMDRMEQERAEMVAEVEAQIERALASMAVDFESDYSRPGSRLSSAAGSISRRPSDASAGVKHRQLRSFGTESTLAESYDDEGAGAQVTTHDVTSKIREATTIKEEDEGEQPLTPSKKKRFSASDLDGQQDGMNAVDEGISFRSDKIAQKVLEIQQKVSRRGPKLGLFMNVLSLFMQLESALQTEPRTAAKWKPESEEDSSESAPPVAARSNSSRSRVRNSMKKRSRSGTASSTQTHTQTDDTSRPTIVNKNRSIAGPEEIKTPTRGSFSDADRDDMSTPEPVTQSSSSDASTGVDKIPNPSHKPPALSARSASTTTGTTADDSDTDFQSAYSTSPRGSYGSFENTKKQPSVAEDDDDEPQPIDIDEDNLREDLGKTAALDRSYRGRVASVVSVVNARNRGGNVNLPFSNTTVTAST